MANFRKAVRLNKRKNMLSHSYPTVEERLLNLIQTTRNPLGQPISEMSSSCMESYLYSMALKWASLSEITKAVVMWDKARMKNLKHLKPFITPSLAS